MDQVSDSIVKIILDMRLLDQYRIRYNKHANAEDLVKILVGKIDALLKKFSSLNKSSRTFYEKLGNIKIHFQFFDERKRYPENEKEGIRININSVDCEKILSLSSIRSKMFEDSLFGNVTGEKAHEIFVKSNSAVNSDDKPVLRNKRGERFKRKPKKRNKF